MKPVTPTTASVTLPLPSLTVRVGLRFVTPISRAASPPRKSPTSDSRESKDCLLCVRGFHGLPFLSDIETRELPKLSGIGRAGLYCIELRIECEQGSLSVGQLRTHPLLFDNDHAGMEALRQIRMEYGRDRYIRDASQIYSGCKDLNEYLQKQVERKGSSSPPKGCAANHRRRRAASGYSPL